MFLRRLGETMKKSLLCLVAVISALTAVFSGSAGAASFTLADWSLDGSDYVSNF